MLKSVGIIMSWSKWWSNKYVVSLYGWGKDEKKIMEKNLLEESVGKEIFCEASWYIILWRKSPENIYGISPFLSMSFQRNESYCWSGKRYRTTVLNSDCSKNLITPVLKTISIGVKYTWIIFRSDFNVVMIYEVILFTSTVISRKYSGNHIDEELWSFCYEESILLLATCQSWDSNTVRRLLNLLVDYYCDFFG